MKSSLVGKKVTLEAIAELIASATVKLATKEQFMSLAGDVSGIDKRLDLMDLRFDAIESKMKETDTRLTGRIDKLESKVDRMLVEHTSRQEFVALDKRLVKVERKLAV